MTEECKVSVLCTAFNHENYIRDALEGFVSQKTDFPFEVLVNDDCSTDGTADVIREYAARYPDIIRPFYQEENLYSKIGMPALFAAVFYPNARGKYDGTGRPCVQHQRIAWERDGGQRSGRHVCGPGRCGQGRRTSDGGAPDDAGDRGEKAGHCSP